MTLERIPSDVKEWHGNYRMLHTEASALERPVFEALTDYVPRIRLDHLVEDLANRLSYVRYLVRDREVTPIG